VNFEQCLDPPGTPVPPEKQHAGRTTKRSALHCALPCPWQQQGRGLNENGQHPGVAGQLLPSSLGGYCLGSVLETVDLAFDLGDALLRFENLAIDPLQFTQQFLSATIQVAFHGGVS
jgi:hypothetical protein